LFKKILFYYNQEKKEREQKTKSTQPNKKKIFFSSRSIANKKKYEVISKYSKCDVFLACLLKKVKQKIKKNRSLFC